MTFLLIIRWDLFHIFLRLDSPSTLPYSSIPSSLWRIVLTSSLYAHYSYSPFPFIRPAYLPASTVIIIVIHHSHHSPSILAKESNSSYFQSPFMIHPLMKPLSFFKSHPRHPSSSIHYSLIYSPHPYVHMNHSISLFSSLSDSYICYTPNEFLIHSTPPPLANFNPQTYIAYRRYGFLSKPPI